MISTHTAYIILGLIVGGFWLWTGILAYGIAYAFYQRHWPNSARKSLYSDMFRALRMIPRGFLGLTSIIVAMQQYGVWDVQKRRPSLGTKYLPRHEYRNHG